VDKLTAIKATEENPDVKVLIFTEFTSTQYMLKKVLEEHALDQPALSIPVLKGHADYLNWIADAADGRG